MFIGYDSYDNVVEHNSAEVYIFNQHINILLTTKCIQKLKSIWYLQAFHS